MCLADLFDADEVGCFASKESNLGVVVGDCVKVTCEMMLVKWKVEEE
jgi:hypothetical protein